MQTLEALTRDALALGRGEFVPAHQTTAQTDEVARVMGICNACRYCEGFCAVFPAMTRRLDFTPADTHYLANLCHNCGACLHACQYAPPHEFALNVPRAMAQVRVTTYADHAWPAAFGALYRRNGAVVALALAAGLALFGLLVLALHGRLWHEPLAGDVPGNFYAVLPHGLMVALFAPVFGWAVLALGIGVGRFWRGVTPGGEVPGAAVVEATQDAVRLRYLDGGHGQGCHDADDRTTHWRRRFHHLTAGGFLLCFASTTVATLYHYLLGQQAPYPVTSLPVLLGTIGGIGLLVGPVGLLWLNLKRDPLHGDPQQRPMDRAFITLLFLVSLTGLALLAGRETGAMAVLLVVHLGAVMALFATLPYGKFAHGVYRVAALVKYAVERRRPNALGVGGD